MSLWQCAGGDQVDLIGEAVQFRQQSQDLAGSGGPLPTFLSLDVPSLPRLREVHGDGLMVLPGLRVSE